MKKYYQRPEVTDVILLPENIMGIDANTSEFKDPSQADAKTAPEVPEEEPAEDIPGWE